MKKYGKYFVLIGITALALGIGVGFLIKNLAMDPAEDIVSEEIQNRAQEIENEENINEPQPALNPDGLFINRSE